MNPEIRPYTVIDISNEIERYMQEHNIFGPDTWGDAFKGLYKILNIKDEVVYELPEELFEIK